MEDGRRKFVTEKGRLLKVYYGRRGLAEFSFYEGGLIVEKCFLIGNLLVTILLFIM